MNHTLIYAHRGANREAAENTRSAFERALRYPIDGIETDVQLSRDGIAVLWHDRFLGKVGLPDQHIDDFDLQDLQAMNFAAHFSPSPLPNPDGTTSHSTKASNNDAQVAGYLPQAGEGANESLREFHITHPESLMTLQSFVDAYRQRCRLLLEIKNRDWETPARQELKVRMTLAMSGIDQAIRVSSFHLDSLVYAHQIAPDFPLIYNVEPEQTIADVQRVVTENPFLHGLCLPITTLNETIVRLLRDHQKCIAVYTCNSDAQINLALALGVDILISDVPQKALQMRSER